MGMLKIYVLCVGWYLLWSILTVAWALATKSKHQNVFPHWRPFVYKNANYSELSAFNFKTNDNPKNKHLSGEFQCTNDNFSSYLVSFCCFDMPLISCCLFSLRKVAITNSIRVTSSYPLKIQKINMSTQPNEVVTLADIYKARTRIQGFVHLTSVYTNATIDNISGRKIFFKSENLQKTGSFKARGALNAVSIICGQKWQKISWDMSPVLQ